MASSVISLLCSSDYSSLSAYSSDCCWFSEFVCARLVFCELYSFFYSSCYFASCFFSSSYFFCSSCFFKSYSFLICSYILISYSFLSCWAFLASSCCFSSYYFLASSFFLASFSISFFSDSAFLIYTCCSVCFDWFNLLSTSTLPFLT